MMKSVWIQTQEDERVNINLQLAERNEEKCLNSNATVQVCEKHLAVNKKNNEKQLHQAC